MLQITKFQKTTHFIAKQKIYADTSTSTSNKPKNDKKRQ
jgi:hypothetical protein